MPTMPAATLASAAVEPRRAWHAIQAEAAVDCLRVDFERGVPGARVQELRSRFGPNRLAEAPRMPVWWRLAEHFTRPLVLVLLAASAIAPFLGEWTDALAIVAIVLVNGLIGFFQEERAGRALAALRRLSSPLARVFRDGTLRTILAEELVPGDRVQLEAGDHVPADVRLIRAYGFATQEAALTGESTTSPKDPGCLVDADVPLGDRRNMAYMGTAVASGRAEALVVAVGQATELGRIAGLLGRTAPDPTPLQRRLDELGRAAGLACSIIASAIFVLYLIRGDGAVDALILSVGLAVAAVPEGLPAVVTVALALGVQRMVRRNVLIRRLSSVEALGSVTVVCSDKTGTLTRNEMTVREVYVGGRRSRVTGTGYAPRGRFLAVAGPIDGSNGRSAETKPASARDGPVSITPGSEPDLLRALVVGLRCNNAHAVPRADREEWLVAGDPTEGALIIAALKAGVGPGEEHVRTLYEIPFDSERKMMSVVVREPGGGVSMETKGAPEVVLGRCTFQLRGGREIPFDDASRREASEACVAMAAKAMRVLALAFRHLPDESLVHREDDLIFVGLVGLIDPPRDEAREAVGRCLGAGIRPIMITGDHPATALAVAREVGIAQEGDRVISGPDLDAMSDLQLAGAVPRISVYARVTAEHKLRVVRAWKARGQIVAMTGDGVNDAPAVQAADIGIAMGLSGTDVTREAAAMVLADDNFASIVGAIEEGRGVFDNIEKILDYLLATNTGEVVLMASAALAGTEPPLTAVQLLWLNLITDGLPALALGMEPLEPEAMSRPPRPPSQPVVTKHQGLRIGLHGILIAAASGAAYAVASRRGGSGHAQAVAFSTIAFAQLFYALVCRSRRRSFLRQILANPYLLVAVVVSAFLQLVVVAHPLVQPAFGVASQPLHDWEIVIAFALVPLVIVELSKLVRPGKGRTPIEQTHPARNIGAVPGRGDASLAEHVGASDLLHGRPDVMPPASKTDDVHLPPGSA